MLLGSRLLRLSAAAAAGVRRSLTTAASHPPWAMISFSSEVVGAPTVDVRLAEPPHISQIRVPGHLIKTSGGCADPASKVVKWLSGTSSGGLLFLTYLDLRSPAPTVGKDGTHAIHPSHDSGVTHFVCNPVTRELSRLPASIFNPVQDALHGARMGFITQADRGHGPPDRFAAAKVGVGRNLMIRFLSETGEWELVEVSLSPSQLLPPRSMRIDQEPLAFGGRMWWVDLSWGVVTADPFSHRPEGTYVQLPRRSVLPAAQPVISYRRVGVSDGWLRYVELSQEKPFLLSSFVLDDEATSWTLEHRVELNKIWGRSMSMPLQTTAGDTEIVLIHPLDSNVVYLRLVATSQTVAVDMDREEVIETCLCSGKPFSTPCLLPPWLRSTRIPSASRGFLKLTDAGALIN
ncbi:uncharacterized protein [Lolium perenne]|uniref:uncharacterized protein isoform X2 n=1 Tax=Lolium perenne TaxID=4522 RepID=UPI0021F64252|nr:uncharacterized protein LOC127320108 isoform X2 [Lolium perenne]